MRLVFPWGRGSQTEIIFRVMSYKMAGFLFQKGGCGRARGWAVCVCGFFPTRGSVGKGPEAGKDSVSPTELGLRGKQGRAGSR